jgi:hypothetical protein
MSATVSSPQDRETLTSNSKNIVPAESVQVNTKPAKLTIGIKAEDMAAIPRPDLSGLRVTSVNPGDPIYLVDPEGFLRFIPNPATFNNLFANWNGIVALDLINIAMAAPLTDEAILAKADNSDTVYIVSNGMKRGIPSPDVMNKYNFNWGAIFVVPHVLLDFMPTGAIWV